MTIPTPPDRDPCMCLSSGAGEALRKHAPGAGPTGHTRGERIEARSVKHCGEGDHAHRDFSSRTIVPI